MNKDSSENSRPSNIAHAATYEQAYRGLYPNGDNSVMIRPSCRCGWRSRKAVFQIDEAVEIWETDHWDELLYQYIRTNLHGKSFREEYDEIRAQWMSQTAKPSWPTTPDTHSSGTKPSAATNTPPSASNPNVPADGKQADPSASASKTPTKSGPNTSMNKHSSKPENE